MAKINIANDLGAPLVVGGVDLLTEKYQPRANEWISYILCAAGYIATAVGGAGDFVKNLGIASLPWAMRHIAARAGFLGGGTSRLVRLPITRYPGPASQTEFSEARLV